MEDVFSLLIVVVITIVVCLNRQKKKLREQQPGAASSTKIGIPESGAMPHNHRKVGSYDTFNKKRFGQEPGAMPHKHEKKHYTSMADTSKLPPGYILLNGEPVRVADLEGK